MQSFTGKGEPRFTSILYLLTLVLGTVGTQHGQNRIAETKQNIWLWGTGENRYFSQQFRERGRNVDTPELLLFSILSFTFLTFLLGTFFLGTFLLGPFLLCTSLCTFLLGTVGAQWVQALPKNLLLFLRRGCCQLPGVERFSSLKNGEVKPSIKPFTFKLEDFK